MLVQKFPKASQEKHLLRGFSFVVVGKPRVTREGLTTTD